MPLLPTELDLCEHYGASRQLQDQGLISRKKAGTRVEAAVPTSGYRQSLASLEDLIQFGAAHIREVSGDGRGHGGRGPRGGARLPGGNALVPDLQRAPGREAGRRPDRLDRRLNRPSLRRSR